MHYVTANLLFCWAHGKGSVVTRLGLDELAELTPPEATIHLTLWCTGQAVVLARVSEI
jgi:hypothetical protein